MSIKNFKLNPLNSSFGVYELTEEDSYRSCIFTSPTANCQLYSIGNVDHILYKDKELRLEIFKFIQRQVSKNIVLLDIKQTIENQVLEIFPDKHDIISRTPYVSTNGSNMLILLINTLKLRDNENIKFS